MVMMAVDCWAERLGNSGGGHLVVMVGNGDRIGLCCDGDRMVVDVWDWGQLSGGRGGVGDVGKCCWCHRWCRLVMPVWCRWRWWKLGVGG